MGRAPLLATLACVLLLLLLTQPARGQATCAPGQYRTSAGVCTNCAAGRSSPDAVACYLCHDNSGVWLPGQGGRGFVRNPSAANCTQAERVCSRGQFVSATGVCTSCTVAGQSSPDWVTCMSCSDDSPNWLAGQGGRGFVKVSGQQTCAAASAVCAAGQFASAGACASCGAGQSSPDGVVCRSCSEGGGVWPTGQGGPGFVKSSTNQACVAASVQCARGQIASGGVCTNCPAGMSGLDSRCWFCNEPGVWPAGQGGPGFVKSSANQTCVRAKAACANLQYSMSGVCTSCASGQNSTDGVTCRLATTTTPPPTTCTLNCALLNTDCRNYTCVAATNTCIISLNRTGNPCNGTRGLCSAGVCVANTTSTGGGGTNTATVPPDASVWPLTDAPNILRIVKAAGFEMLDANGNSLESQWMHLHFDGDTASRSLTLTIDMVGTSGYSQGTTPSGIQVRYTAQDVPISPWLAPSAWAYTITQDSPWLANLNDGVLDLSLQVMGTNRASYRPWPAFLHLKRNRTLSALVPVMVGDNPTSMGPRIPGVTRVARSERRTISYPANPSLTRWSTPPQSTALYLEQLTPGGDLFEEMQMWWEDLPSHPGLTFIRGLQPYQGEDVRETNHSRLPVQDGPRGVGWMSGYVSGKVDNAGQLVFAELAGRVGWLKPTGEIVTIAGWVTKPGVAPVWIRKSMAAVRGSQELRGTGTPFTSVGGFGQPIDTAFDSSNPNVVYVADNGRHCIWRITIGAIAANGVPAAEVALLAGSADGTSGYQNGPGLTARFNRPYSISWTMFAGTPSLYVSDSANHAVRRINLTSGVVSTVWGDGPSAVDNLTRAGVGLFDRGALRSTISATVTAAAAASGKRPTIYWPAALRTDSNGNVILLEHGYAYIRRLDPLTNSATVITPVDKLKFGEWDHGWAWLDVDVTGAAGPMNGVYWVMAVGDSITGATGSHFNEIVAFALPQENAQSNFIFTGRGGGANPVGFGERIGTTPPHYPWLVAVDPRGGVLLSGMGVHGITRLRLNATGDPTATESYSYWLGDQVFDGPGVGPAAASLAFRAGNGAHGMMGLGVDGWGTRGFATNDTALLEYYGAAALSMTADARTNLLTYLRAQTGPARDALPTTAADSGPPTVPTGLVMSAGHLGINSIFLRWNLATDDRAVFGYTLQLVRTLVSDTTSGAALFTPTNIAAPINAELARYNNAALGNVEGTLLEALSTDYVYWARLAARDLANKTSAWSEPVSYLLSSTGLGSTAVRRAARRAARARATAPAEVPPAAVLAEAAVAPDVAPVAAESSVSELSAAVAAPAELTLQQAPP